MKALAEMNNVEKGYLLTKLFPEHMETMARFVAEQTEKYRAHEQYVRDNWAKTMVTDNFWYGLVDNFERLTSREGKSLYRNAGIFSDQFFDGYNAIFMICCLVEYAACEKCDGQLRRGIHLLFGEEKLISITFNENRHG